MKTKEERDGNQAELEISFGYLVTYGERIQLRHIHSDAFVTTSDKMANEPGTLKVELDLLGNENLFQFFFISLWIRNGALGLARRHRLKIERRHNARERTFHTTAIISYLLINFELIK